MVFAVRSRVISQKRIGIFGHPLAVNSQKIKLLPNLKSGFQLPPRRGLSHGGRLRWERQTTAYCCERKTFYGHLLRTQRYLRKTRLRKAPFNPSDLLYERLWECGVPFANAVFSNKLLSQPTVGTSRSQRSFSTMGGINCKSPSSC